MCVCVCACLLIYPLWLKSTTSVNTHTHCCFCFFIIIIIFFNCPIREIRRKRAEDGIAIMRTYAILLATEGYDRDRASKRTCWKVVSSSRERKSLAHATHSSKRLSLLFILYIVYIKNKTQMKKKKKTEHKNEQ